MAYFRSSSLHARFDARRRFVIRAARADLIVLSVETSELGDKFALIFRPEGGRIRQPMLLLKSHSKSAYHTVHRLPAKVEYARL
jgi:hypothetical protein